MICIVGAGMAGLLAGCMLRDHEIIEKNDSLPNNHHAVLRFRSSVVGDTLNIPFKAVRMMKCLAPHRNPVADQLSYSLKATGCATLRSALTAQGQVSERFIAPPDLISRMAAMCRIKFGQEFKQHTHERGISSTISTMPMPVLMRLLSWPEIPDFRSRAGWVIRRQLIAVDAYCSVYDPNPFTALTRASITGSELIVELANPAEYDASLERAIDILGLPPHCLLPAAKEGTLLEQKYAKILPIDEGVRRRFIMWASDNFGIYSLGRFATWRPGILLDDVVNDVRVIQKLIVSNTGATYSHKIRGA